MKIWKISKDTGRKEEVLALHGGENRGMCMQARLYQFRGTPHVACLLESGHFQVTSLTAGAWAFEEKVYGEVPVGLDFSFREAGAKIKMKAVCCGSGDSVVAFTTNGQSKGI